MLQLKRIANDSYECLYSDEPYLELFHNVRVTSEHIYYDYNSRKIYIGVDEYLCPTTGMRRRRP
jgi:hypothetical protein